MHQKKSPSDVLIATGMNVDFALILKMKKLLSLLSLRKYHGLEILRYPGDT
jgi:hypothetical protein